MNSQDAIFPLIFCQCCYDPEIVGLRFNPPKKSGFLPNVYQVSDDVDLIVATGLGVEEADARVFSLAPRQWAANLRRRAVRCLCCPLIRFKIAYKMVKHLLIISSPPGLISSSTAGPN